jgi:DNA modification methylase
MKHLQNKQMNVVTLNIEDIIRVHELENLYAKQPIEDLLISYKQNGQKTPVHVNSKWELINGYRMLDAIQVSGGTTVIGIVMDGDPTIYDRMILNQCRVKTTQDKVTEIRLLFKKFPKKQGKKNTKKEMYVRDKSISAACGDRWKGDDIIRKLEYVLDNDIKDDVLSKGIIDKNWKVETCFTFLKEKQKLNHEGQYGFTEKLLKGEIDVVVANKLITQKYFLDNEYEHTFVIPEKGNTYNINCLELSKLPEYKKTVDLILTSPPYFKLRKYDNTDSTQLGHEKTKEEYCKNVSIILRDLVPTLKETANVLINIGETYHAGVGLGIPQLLKQDIENNTSLIYKDTLIWSKPNPKPQNEGIQRPINNVEYLLWFVVNPEKSKYNLLKFPVKGKKTKISHGCKDVDKNGIVLDKNISLTKPYGKFYSHLKEQEVLNIIECSIGKNHDVYKICEDGHPAIMSSCLPVIPILMTTNEGDTVLDPFSGSNVVGRISQLLNRRSLTAELSQGYFKIGCKMLDNAVKDFNRHDLDFINSEIYQQESNEQISIAA